MAKKIKTLDTDMIGIFNAMIQSLDGGSIKQNELWEIAYSIDVVDLTSFGYNLSYECKKTGTYLPDVISDLSSYYCVSAKRTMIKETLNKKQQGRLFMEILASWDSVPLVIKELA